MSEHQRPNVVVTGSYAKPKHSWVRRLWVYFFAPKPEPTPVPAPEYRPLADLQGKTVPPSVRTLIARVTEPYPAA